MVDDGYGMVDDGYGMVDDEWMAYHKSSPKKLSVYQNHLKYAKNIPLT